MGKAASDDRKMVAVNRKARHDYFIDDVYEAGLVLLGTEVKSLRAGRANIGDAYVVDRGGELFMVHAHISEYEAGNQQNHEPRRPRKLLLRRREISKLIGTIKRGGTTLVPLSFYFNEGGRAKVELAVATGKRKYDKRQTEKTRDWQRQKARLVRSDD